MSKTSRLRNAHPGKRAITEDAALQATASFGASSAGGLRHPYSWLLIWGVYILAVLGWLAYREALAGFYCGVV